MTKVHHDLIYDVGLHDGADTAYYLHQGYRVVAIDANPTMIDAARRRFSSEIADKQLVLLPIGIAPGSGTATFWVSDEHTDWSSFDVSVASRGGATHHPVEVGLRPFREVLECYGLPIYCKIDIEGNDYLCLEGMSRDLRPSFVSVELSDREKPLLEILGDLGFNRFKVVNQRFFAPARHQYYRARAAIPFSSARAVMDAISGRLRHNHSSGSWRFAVGSSGPMPHQIRGRWLTYRSADDLIQLLAKERHQGRLGLGDWFDLHATTVEVRDR